jgi:SnoaL-like domain
MIENVIIKQYFEALNNGDFAAVVELFAPDGVLQPPFHPPILGRAAIAQYLQEEAIGINLSPARYSCQPLESGQVEHTVSGKVQTSLLCVNALWNIVLEKDSKISFVRVKLLASLAELLKVRPDQKREG